MKKFYILEITAFLTGFLVMTVELVASRILAPYIGTSLFIWTNLLAIILAGLSIGYLVGGKIAIHVLNKKTLALFVVISSLCIALTALYSNFVLEIVNRYISSIHMRALVNSIILFVPQAIALGAITPYIVHLKQNDLKQKTSIVGNYYALSTLGSIIGVYLTGYFFIPTFGSISILYMASVIFFILSLLIHRNFKFYPRLVALGIFIIAYLLRGLFPSSISYPGRLLYRSETMYSKISIIDIPEEKTGRIVRHLYSDRLDSSSIYIDNGDIVSPYENIFLELDTQLSQADSILLIGAGAYTIPTYLQKKYPELKMDIVEIDPTLTSLAKKYFNYNPSPIMTTWHGDGRVFVNTFKNKKYDLIIIDAYSSKYIPFQLVTKEVIAQYEQLLDDNGAVAVNIISSINGDEGKLLRSVLSTFKLVFSHVLVIPTKEQNGNRVQNIVVLATKKPENTHLLNTTPWTAFIDKGQILSDDYAPVEFMVEDMRGW